jgi:hypothetical protein
VLTVEPKFGAMLEMLFKPACIVRILGAVSAGISHRAKIKPRQGQRMRHSRCFRKSEHNDFSAIPQ